MSKPTFVYADINCPFCYALHERLLKHNLLTHIEWRLIEHAPAANSKSIDPKLVELLGSEYQLVLKRATEVVIHNPHFIPNTALINETILAFQEQHPELSDDFRERIYKALWLEGEDISDPEVISRLLSHYGVQALICSDHLKQKLSYWQELWVNGDFDLRIPAMGNVTGEVMLGLQNPLSIKRFINRQEVLRVDKGSVCQYKKRDKIAVLSAPYAAADVQSLFCDAEFEVLMVDKLCELKTLTEDKDVALIMIDHQLDKSFSLCRSLNFNVNVEVPIVYFAQSINEQDLLLAYTMGAVDMFELSQATALTLEKLKVHLRYKKKLDILTSHASHDSLTGLYNRREIDQTLERSWRSACRYGKELSVFMIDIDFFKRYNDHYGHPAGDEALMIVANVLASGRSEDVVGRIGGEEFIIIVHDTPEKELMTIAKRLFSDLKSHDIAHAQSSVEAHLTFSIGIATTTAHADNNYRMLLEEADKALYKAKALGRNQAQLYRLAQPNYS